MIANAEVLKETHRHPLKTSARKVARSIAARLIHSGREIGLPIAVLSLVAFFSVTSDVFLTAQNFQNVGLQSAALAAVAFGQTFVILTGGLDLSVGSTVALVSVVTGLGMAEFGTLPGMALGFLAGAGVGVGNGIVITRFRVFPFVATLAMLSMVSGLALNLSGGTPIIGLSAAFTNLAFMQVLGVPVPLLISLGLLACAWAVLQFTRLGRNIYAVGGNEEAARLSGISIGSVRLAAYVLCSTCTATGALILTARVASGQPTLGGNLPLESVAAVVLGGVSLFGGRGSITGVAFGVAFVSILSNGLNLLNVSSYTQMIVIGAALIIAMAFDQAIVRWRGHDQ